MYIGDSFINPLSVVDWYFGTTFLGRRYIHINFVNGHFREIYTYNRDLNRNLNEREIDKKLKEFIINRTKNVSC
ncbi:MAG: hypothetical protein IJV31_08065 [Clostridia bacterium]|nr:hypothetical protein [Clostridia bacterium]